VKRETLRHPKTYDLAARLGIDRPAALGILQLLWDYTGEVAPRGDLGKWSDGVIAQACDWRGDPAQFVGVLVDARWLDKNDACRLIVHDWADHCEEWVVKKLQRMGLDFLECYGSKRLANSKTKKAIPPLDDATPSRPCRDGVETTASQCRDVLPPILSEPNRTEPEANPNPSHPVPSKENPSVPAVPASHPAEPVDWPAAAREASAVCRRLRLQATTRQDRSLVLGVCALTVRGDFPRKWLAEAVEATAGGGHQKPWAYFYRCMSNQASSAGVNLDAALAPLEIPENLATPHP
jgi:hypothetical protein